MKFSNLKKAFTLTEVLIVVSILGILGAMVMWNIHNNINKANDAVRKADIKKITTAFEEYYSDNDCYPPSSILSSCGGTSLKPYIDSIPCDPVYKEPYCYLPVEPTLPDCYQKYRLLGTLKYLSDPTIKSSNCDSGQYCGWETECGASVDGDDFGYNYGFSSLNTVLLNPSMPVDPPDNPTPGGGGRYACGPIDPYTGKSTCNSYEDPERDGCIRTFQDPVECQEYCDIGVGLCRS